MDVPFVLRREIRVHDWRRAVDVDVEAELVMTYEVDMDAGGSK